MSKKILALIIVIALFSTMVTGCSPNTKTPDSKSSDASTKDTVYTLKFSYNPAELTPETSLETNFAYAFRDYLETNAPGKFDVQIYPAAQLGTFSEAYSGTSDGSIEMAMINIATISSIDKTLDVWQIPGLIRSIDECNTLLASEEGLATFDKAEEITGTTVMTSFTAGPRHFTNSVRELHSPSDLKGIVFRVMENQLYIEMVGSLGGIPTPMSSSEMYSALQNKVVEGQENPIVSIINDLTFEVQKYLTLDGHVFSIPVLVANTKWLESLPKDLQQIVIEATDVARNSAIKFVERQEVEGLKFLKENGMKVYEPSEEELEEWHTAVYNSTINFVVKSLGQENVDNFKNIVEGMR